MLCCYAIWDSETPSSNCNASHIPHPTSVSAGLQDCVSLRRDAHPMVAFMGRSWGYIWGYIYIYIRDMWYMMIYDDIWWYMMIYDDIWWYMMIYDDIWWYMMIYDNIWWYMMIYDDIWWYMTLSYIFLIWTSPMMWSLLWFQPLRKHSGSH